LGHNSHNKTHEKASSKGAKMNFEPFPSSYYRRGNVREGALAAFFAATYAWMALGLLVTAATAFIVAQVPALRYAILGTPLMYLIVIGQFALVIWFSRQVITCSPQQAAGMFLAYAASVGLTFSSVFVVFPISTLVQAFAISGSGFGLLAAYGALTKRDLTPLAQFMMFGFWGLLIATIVNIFLQSDLVDFVTSCCGVIIFSGLTAYDNQSLRQMYQVSGNAGNLSLRGALKLYLDFLNMFIFILNLLSRSEDRR
jgi:FtsH-binding integral membrane protein